MIKLFLVVLGLIAISFLCSILEAVILSISRSYIEILVEKGSRSGRWLLQLKERIEEPIAAILTLNTISHTVGAAVSGAIAMQVFGSHRLAVFSAVLTLLILIFSEIIPKTIGARYWKRLGPFSAYCLKGMIFIMKPLIVPIHYISRLFSKGNADNLLSKREIFNTIRLGYLQGVLQPQEFEIMDNLFKLQSIKVEDIMTPRPVVFTLPADYKISDIESESPPFDFSRIPLYDARENSVEGIVLRRDIVNYSREKKDATLKSLSRPAFFVPDTISTYRLLNRLIEQKIHLAVVINEFGDFIGIVTMEDAIETLLGKEIVDEYDRVADMRELARKKSRRMLEKQARGEGAR
ncbi:MAG: HlyC/CorC family transporter [Candidatus Aminicenantes bacterium]|nr:HlyC/CorC family transporter [Candidatus Aminicenantes bacterium]